MMTCSKFWSLVSAGMILLPLAQSFHSMHNGNGPLMSTELQNSQKKKPRFTQQAHTRKTKPIPKKIPQPWDSGKSIDELESTLESRWGTLDDPALGPKKSSSSSSKSSSSDLRKPVFDPWQEEKPRAPIIREYYDEDDEGFEYIEIGEDEEIDDDAVYEEEIVVTGSAKKNGSTQMKVAHLISPKPVGGRGTNQLDEEPETGSYFFNPRTAPEEKEINGDKKTAETNNASQNAKLPEPANVVEALLDENGKPLLLTLNEALKRFESTLGDTDMEAIDSSQESPIVALAKRQSWEDLGITSPTLLENLAFINCPTPLDVQVKSIPPAMTGNDVLIGTYTGSGKTLSFLTPLVQRLLWNEDIEGIGLTILIIAPGRELASQIASVTRELIQDTGLKVQLAIGGTTFSRNLEQIRKRRPNILVGTPGRVAELVVGKPGEK